MIKETLYNSLCESCKNQNQKLIGSLANNYFCQFRKKWQIANRNKNRFLVRYAAWLETSVTIPCNKPRMSNVGPQKVKFDNLSYAGKYKRTKKLREFETSELVFATEIGLRTSGKPAAASLLAQVANSSNESVKHLKISNDSNNNQKTSFQMSPEKALSLIIDTNLSKRQYQLLRNNAKENNLNLYPPYNTIRNAKQLCYPSDITATEHSVCVTLQSLLDHTVSRLFLVLELSSDNFNQTNNNLTLLSKWGCDGSSGQKEYKQGFQEGDFIDSNLFLSCLVPLALYSKDLKNKKILLWQNPRPSSAVYCRPIKMQFLKETIEVSKNEKSNMDKEIQQLVETVVVVSEHLTAYIKHELIMSMIDGKMISALTDTSSQKCFICGALPSHMNDIDVVLKRPIREDNLKFGTSTLHAWIRFLECLLR